MPLPGWFSLGSAAFWYQSSALQGIIELLSEVALGNELICNAGASFLECLAVNVLIAQHFGTGIGKGLPGGVNFRCAIR